MAAAPLDPGWAPFVPGHPNPCEIVVPHPATVVIGDPTPLSLGIIGRPIPTVVVGIDPVPNGIRSPIAVDIRRQPDFAPALMSIEPAVRLKRGAEFGRYD